MGSKICDTCRKKLSKTIVGGHVESDLESRSESAVSLESDLKTEVPYVDSPEALSALNRCLVEIGETPYISARPINVTIIL